MIMRRKITETLRKRHGADVVDSCAAHKALVTQIAPKINEHGFLKK